MDLFFLLGVTFICIHELDAIQQREWRFFFPFVNDETGYQLFNFAHIPLFLFILWNLEAPWFQTGFSIFLIIHAGLHWLLRNHPLITFNNRFSILWIYGGAAFGALHTMMKLIEL